MDFPPENRRLHPGEVRLAAACGALFFLLGLGLLVLAVVGLTAQVSESGSAERPGLGFNLGVLGFGVALLLWGGDIIWRSTFRCNSQVAAFDGRQGTVRAVVGFAASVTLLGAVCVAMLYGVVQGRIGVSDILETLVVIPPVLALFLISAVRCWKPLGELLERRSDHHSESRR